MVIYLGEGLLQTDDIKARGIADFDLMSLSQRSATNRAAGIGHQMVIYSGGTSADRCRQGQGHYRLCLDVFVSEKCNK